MQNINNTQYFRVEKEPELQVKDVLAIVYRALSEKGYNPLNQIVGYIMSGDPTYITSHNNARSLIMKVERDELVEEVLKAYIKNNHWNKYRLIYALQEKSVRVKGRGMEILNENIRFRLWLKDCRCGSQR